MPSTLSCFIVSLIIVRDLTLSVTFELNAIDESQARCASGSRCAVSSLRQRVSAMSMSLKAIVNAWLLVLPPFVIRCRRRTVANTESIGLLVRERFPC